MMKNFIYLNLEFENRITNMNCDNNKSVDRIYHTPALKKLEEINIKYSQECIIK